MEPTAVTGTIIIGAGQAGLSVARYLKEKGGTYIILDQEKQIGASWINRYDSLIIDSFAKYSHLEGFPFPGDQKRQPHKNEVAEYLKSFADTFGITPVFDTLVLSIQKEGDLFITITNNGIYESSAVVLATGPFNTPSIPFYASNLPKDIHQLHAKQYKNERELLPGTVLVVGGGNSGSEIAKELIETGRQIFFSYKGKLKSVPSSQLSQWMAYRLGLAHIPQKSLLGKLVRWYTKGKAVGMDVGMLLNNENVISVGRITGITPEGKILSEKGNVGEVSVVIWATGYKSDFSIIDIPDFDPDLHTRGVTNIKGLYVLNIRWQYSKSSSHLAGISRDAKYIANKICTINPE
ncbi:MAG: NAD(P)/FAD-dependent oxidoreductase [Patescibacteria group bacterium]